MGEVMSDLILMDRVQFIYELALAKLELEGLNAKFRVTNSFRRFILESGDIELLRRRVAYFKEIDGKATLYEQLVQYNQTRSINQYLTHWIYPYKGKFHPQMIRALFNYMQMKEGELVLDPFIGSGTTALEAQLMGIDVIGVDVSPLCVLQSRVKTQAVYKLNKILELKQQILKIADVSDDSHKEKELEEYIQSIHDEDVRNFYIIAEMIAHSDKKRRKRNFAQSFKINVEKMVLSITDFKNAIENLDLKLGNVDIRKGDARNLDIDKCSIDGIVTSPPYSIALDYVKNDSHALEALGYNTREIKEEFIGVRGTGSHKIELYNQDMMKSLDEMFRVLKPGKYCVIVIGDATYRGKRVETVKFIIDYAQNLGFELIKNLDKVIFGLYNVMQKENILIFRKPVA